MPASGWQPYHAIWGVLFLGWLATGVIRAALAPLLPLVREEFGITFGQAGDLATAYFLAYAALQFVSGNLGDRWGRKRILVLGGILSVLATLGSAAAWSPAALFVARLAVGIGHGTIYGNDRPLIAACTPPGRMGLGQGVSFAGLGIGVWFGTAAAGLLAGLLPWRGVFAVLAVLPALSTVLLGVRVGEPPRAGVGGAAPTGFHLALTNRDLWLLYVAGLTPSFAQWVIGTWGPSILLEAGARDLSTAALYAGFFGLMAMPGLLAFGALSDRTAARGWGRKLVVVGGYLALAAVMGTLGWGISSGAPYWVLAPLMALVGAVTWGPWAAVLALFSEIVPARILGTTLGLLNGWAMLGSVLGPPVAGRLRDAGGSFASACLLAAALTAVGGVLIAAVRPAFRPGPEEPVGGRGAADGGRSVA